MFSFAGATLLSIQFKKLPRPYVSCWIIGLILNGSAVLLVALKDVLPELVSYKIGNSLNIAAYVYFYYSCRSLLGERIVFSRILLKAFSAAFIFFISLVFISGVFDSQHQPAIVSLCGLVFNFYTGLLALDFYRQRNNQFALPFLIIFFLTAFIWGLRSVMIIFSDLSFAFQGGLANIIFFMLLLVLGIAKYMIFSGLVTSIEWDKKEKLINQVNSMKSELANKKIEQAELQLLTSLNALAKARDNETGNHIIRTQNYVNLLAQNLRAGGHYVDQLSDKAIDALVKAAPLHDIGKVGIPDSILLKQSSLTAEEWAVMKTHTTIGESVLGAANIESESDADVISKAIKIAGGHHEQWNGAGYPRGLAGQAISLEARIMSVADMYDALVSERTYKPAWTHEEAIKEILSKREIKFDPVIVDVFVANQDLFRDIAMKYKD